MAMVSPFLARTAARPSAGNSPTFVPSHSRGRAIAWPTMDTSWRWGPSFKLTRIARVEGSMAALLKRKKIQAPAGVQV